MPTYDNLIPLPQTSFSGKLPRKPHNQAVRSREYLTEAEVGKLMKAARNTGRHGHRDATLILIAYRHALRVAELVSLRSGPVGSPSKWPCSAPGCWHVAGGWESRLPVMGRSPYLHDKLDEYTAKLRETEFEVKVDQEKLVKLEQQEAERRGWTCYCAAHRSVFSLPMDTTWARKG
jgi:site-specific recombinase XerD